MRKGAPSIAFVILVTGLLAAKDVAEIRSVNFESLRTYTRIIIAVSHPVQYKYERIANPERLYFDIENSMLPSGEEGCLPVNDGILKRIELYQKGSETVRVVIYLDNVEKFNPYLITEPDRLVIDVYRKSEKATGSVEKATTKPGNEVTKIVSRQISEQKPKDKLFLMGIGMWRLNWTKVKGNEIRFRYSDLGLPPDFSTRERASFVMDGTYGGRKYKINGHLNYDPENRITEPPLNFLITTGNENKYISIGDYSMGFFGDWVFTRYYHPFRGGLIGAKSERLGFELIGGMSRGTTGIDEFRADAGAGPYYLKDSPIIRGSEVVFLVVKSATNPDIELKRTPMIRNKDYFIDYDRGALIFNYPLYPFDELGNPVYLIISYQFESLIGRFTRDVLGFRSFFSPSNSINFNFSYVADSDGRLKIEDAWKQRRGIYSFGLKIDTNFSRFLGEFSLSKSPSAEKQLGFFGGGVINFSKYLRLYFNSWQIEGDFPTFANEQLQYGYSLQQIFPSLVKTVFLSPFQFTRNLGAELYPFSLSRLSVGEREVHTYMEWEKGYTNFSGGIGERKELLRDIFFRTFFLSSLQNGEKTKIWAKAEVDKEFDKEKEAKNSLIEYLLFGVRQKLWSGTKGEVYIQTDYTGDSFDDLLNLSSDKYHHSGSVFLEYLTGNEGIFGGYRKEALFEKKGKKLLDIDIYETGIRSHIYKGLFFDSRFRREDSHQDSNFMDNRILSLGGGVETKVFRAMARYEVQMNKSTGGEGKRKLWSLFLSGSPYKDLSLSIRYYKQKSGNYAPLSLSERAEEQLSSQIIWRIASFLSLYSQWRYDTNFELYPPLDRTRGNSLASVQGIKLNFTKSFNFLANYKLIKVWGPIENKKESGSAELGYLFLRHFRLAIGAEKIHFYDKFDAKGNYDSTVWYTKLVALY